MMTKCLQRIGHVTRDQSSDLDIFAVYLILDDVINKEDYNLILNRVNYGKPKQKIEEDLNQDPT